MTEKTDRLPETGETQAGLRRSGFQQSVFRHDGTAAEGDPFFLS